MPNYYLLMSAALFCSLELFAVEIVIRDGQVVEEKKPEEKKPELPPSASLTVNVINFTNFDAIIAVQASELGSTTHTIIVQNSIAKQSSLTLGKYFSPSASTTYEMKEYSVIAVSSLFSQKLECQLQETPVDANGAPTQRVIKKSIDIYVYTPADQVMPKCAIYFDAN